MCCNVCGVAAAGPIPGQTTNIMAPTTVTYQTWEGFTQLIGSGPVSITSLFTTIGFRLIGAPSTPVSGVIIIPGAAIGNINLFTLTLGGEFNLTGGLQTQTALGRVTLLNGATFNARYAASTYLFFVQLLMVLDVALGCDLCCFAGT